MSAPGISPSVMINRLVLQDGDSTTPHLAKVAKLRMDLMTAADREQVKAENRSPSGEVAPLDLTSGAVVDKLI